VASPSPIDLYRRAATDALAVAERVQPDQLDLPKPCSAWTVQDLLDHLVGGTRYLGSVIAGTEASAPSRSTAADLRGGFDACLAGLAQPGALERTCTSPVGFDWTVLDATAGTFMDVLILAGPGAYSVSIARRTAPTPDPRRAQRCRSPSIHPMAPAWCPTPQARRRTRRVPALPIRSSACVMSDRDVPSRRLAGRMSCDRRGASVARPGSSFRFRPDALK
jgi:hypothetical protein